MKKISLIIALLFSADLMAAPEFEGKVSSFYINSSGTVLFKIANSEGLSTSSCPAGLWPFQFSTTHNVAKEWISMLIAARAAKETMRVGYSVPSDGGRCGVAYLYFK